MRGRSCSFNGLERSTSESLYARPQNRVNELLNDEATTSTLAIGPEITAFKNSITALFTCPKYLRQSHTQEVRDDSGRLTRGLDGRTRQKLAPAALEALQWAKSATDSDTLEETRNQANEAFLEDSIPKVRQATEDMLRTGLTEE